MTLYLVIWPEACQSPAFASLSVKLMNIDDLLGTRAAFTQSNLGEIKFLKASGLVFWSSHLDSP